MTHLGSGWRYKNSPLCQSVAVDDPQVKFLLVAIDYFTKWVEAKALAIITEAKAQSFVWKNIVCRFGILRMIISDNGRQFEN